MLIMCLDQLEIKVARNQNLNKKAAKISQKTLDDAMKQLIRENSLCKNENRT